MQRGIAAWQSVRQGLPVVERVDPSTEWSGRTLLLKTFAKWQLGYVVFQIRYLEITHFTLNTCIPMFTFPGISFTPREIGQHVVSVKRMGQHIVNSPFKITVGEREVGDAKKVKVTGNGLKEGKTHVENLFTVDTRSAGE